MNIFQAYEHLQVEVGSSEEVAKAAYRKLIRSLHPDRNPSKEMAEKCSQVNVAWSILNAFKFPSDVAKAIQDTRGSENYKDNPLMRNTHASVVGATSDEDDDEEEHAPRRGRNITRSIKISLSESLNGTVVTVSGQVRDNCHVCDGRKIFTFTCKTCDGTGFPKNLKKLKNVHFCPDCEGFGSHEKECECCGGTGIEKDIRRYEIRAKVPAGVTNDSELVLRGYGGKSAIEGNSGDITLKVVVELDDGFSFDKNGNLKTKVGISKWDLLYAKTVSMTLLGKEVSLNLRSDKLIYEIVNFTGNEHKSMSLFVEVKEDPTAIPSLYAKDD